MLERKRATQLQLIVTRDTGVVKARTIIDGVTVSLSMLGLGNLSALLNTGFSHFRGFDYTQKKKHEAD